ncbi:MAG: ABC transporter substrate-binding protein [Planctomycetota bacterium]|nr:MAG: ABC transporter substrate-binding protein [Planctomycetota bacterium]
MAAAVLLLACASVLAPAQERADSQGPGARAPAARPAAARIAFYAQAQTFDPAGGGTFVDGILQQQVYETLVEYDCAAGAPYTRMRPLLAEHWESSDDGKLWLFVLRDDAHFHDPYDPPLWPERTRPVTAHDVVYSWLRETDFQSSADNGYAFEGLIAGLDEFHRATAQGADSAAAAWKEAESRGGLADLRALDDRCLLVRLARAEPSFLFLCAESNTAVVAREAVARSGRNFLNQPVGTGPFYLAEWIPGSQAQFRRVSGWRGDPSPFGDGPLPFLDELRVLFVPEPSTRTQLFEAQELEMLSVLGDAYGRLVQDGRPNAELSARGVSLLPVLPVSMSMITINMDDPVLGMIPGDEAGNARRLKLRQALSLAFPYERWAQAVRGGDWAERARSFLPAYMAASAACPQFGHGVESGAEAQRLQQARRLLAEAGYPEGRGLEELVVDLAPPDRVTRTGGEVVAEGWSRIGVRVRQQVGSWAEMQQRTTEGEFQMMTRTWTMQYPDATDLLTIFYGGSGPVANRGRFHDADFDRGFEAYQATTDAAQRDALVVQMVQRLNAAVPVIPIDFPGGTVLLQPWLKNVRMHPFQPYACKYYRIEAP